MNDFMAIIESGRGRAVAMVWLGGNEVRVV